MYYTIQPPLLITMHILVYCTLHCALCIDLKCHCLHPIDPFKCCMPAQIQQYIYYKRPCRDNYIKFAQFLYLTHTLSSFCHFLSDPHHSLYLRALFQFKKGKKRARKDILFFQQKSQFLSYKTFQYPFLPCITWMSQTTNFDITHFSHRIHLVSFNALLCPTCKNVLDCIVWVNYPGQASVLEGMVDSQGGN